MIRTEVAIVGSGFSGLGMAIRLQEAGVRDLVVLEKASSVGGTWRDNTYPGCACDIPSHLYSFSFDLNPDWTRVWSPQAEIREYLEACVDRHGLRDRILLDAGVERAVFDEDEALWHLHTADGREVVARVVVHGVGALRDPAWPDIPGRETFEGPQLHSARWDHDVDLAGRGVGVIGTGASAVQLVPRLADEASELTVFQRTAPWIVPRPDRAYRPLEKALFRRIPGAMRLYRTLLYLKYELRYPLFFRTQRLSPLAEAFYRRFIASEVDDVDLRRAVTPDYRIGCKRVLVSSEWYPTLAREHVHLETERVEAITPHGVRLADGREVEVDALVYGTGFKVDEPLGDMEVEGLGGRDLAEEWGGRPRAYLGMAVPGFPNAFLLLGPNTALGHNSVVVMIEAQVRYVAQAVRYLREHPDVAWLDVRPHALGEFVEEVDARHRDQVWASGCDSWYLGRGDENFTLWPGSTVEYILRTRRFDPEPYEVVRR
ncbi:MAG: flavin-containing monooxygenase [Myxococcota bacterium]